MNDPEQTYDVGILGWWYGKNYGSILTYYGLNRAIEELGFRTLMVHEPLGYNGYRVLWPDDILSVEFARRVGYHYTTQMHFSELPALNARAGTFIVGSDQLWNPLIGRVNDDLFLDFVSPENRRLAYATSFGNRGTTKFKPDFIQKHSANLQKFNAISVREGYAVDTARAAVPSSPAWRWKRSPAPKCARHRRSPSPPPMPKSRSSWRLMTTTVSSRPMPSPAVRSPAPGRGSCSMPMPSRRA